MAELKMWIAVRADLDMPVGKLCAQVGHGVASTLMAALQADPQNVADYFSNSQTKIAVRVNSEVELIRVHDEARQIGIPTALIMDAGRTIFAEPTRTVCAFGPCEPEKLTGFLKRLRLL